MATIFYPTSQYSWVDLKDDSDREEKKSMSSTSAPNTRNCVSCGRAMAWDANVCPYCGHDYRMVMQPQMAPKKESAMPVIGGVLILLASLGYLIGGGILAAGSTVLLGLSLGTSAVGVVCGGVLIILGVISLMGGIYAIQRRNFGLALVGGIFVIPSILGLIGMILVAVSKDEFH